MKRKLQRQHANNSSRETRPPWYKSNKFQILFSYKHFLFFNRHRKAGRQASKLCSNNIKCLYTMLLFSEAWIYMVVGWLVNLTWCYQSVYPTHRAKTFQPHLLYHPEPNSLHKPPCIPVGWSVCGRSPYNPKAYILFPIIQTTTDAALNGGDDDDDGGGNGYAGSSNKCEHTYTNTAKITKLGVFFNFEEIFYNASVFKCRFILTSHCCCCT